MESRIHVLTVNVDYSDLLGNSIARWAEASSLLVVTSTTDCEAVDQAHRHGAATFKTDAFYLDGAMFNKGRAIEEARQSLPRDGWHLLVDADVIPPADWLDIVNASDLKPGSIYGCSRSGVKDVEIAGFFMLFHSSDPRARFPIDQHWKHAGNYDTTFVSRWQKSNRVRLPLTLEHQGRAFANWCGRGRDGDMASLMRERRRLKGWRHETI